MKKPILFLILILSFLSIKAQAPLSFKYQAVARDAMNQPYSNVNLAVRIMLIRGGTAGTIDYSERHLITTTDLGVFDIQIGTGTVLSGIFDQVLWGDHAYYLNVAIDPEGNSNYFNMGTSQLLSVPYALYAKEAGNGGGSDADTDPTNEIQILEYDPNTQTLSLSGSNAINLELPNESGDDQVLSLSGTNLTIENGNTIDLSALQDGVIDDDSNPNNEIQNLSFDPISNQLSISGANSVTIPTSGTDADPDPTNELQDIQLSGTNLSITEGSTINLGILQDGVIDDDSNPNNEIQNLSFDPNSNQLSISGANSVTIPTGGTDADPDPTNELQDIQLNGTNLSITEGSTINLGVLQDGVQDDDSNPSNELQTISKTGNTITLSDGGGSVIDEVEDADADPNNEIQSLSLNGNTLNLTNGGSVDLPSGVDNQQLSLTGTQLSIQNGNTVDLSAIQDGTEDADSNPNNELQSLSKTGNTISLSNGGGSVTDEVEDADADPNNEIQNLSLNGNNLQISGGNNVSLAGIGGSSLWSANGVGIDFTTGRVGIGTNNPIARLHVENSGETLRIGGESPLISFFHGNNYRSYIWTSGNAGNDLEFGTAAGTNGDMVFSTEAVPKMRLTNAGSLSIGGGGATPAKVEIRHHSTQSTSPHLLLTETDLGYVDLSFENTLFNNQRWLIRGLHSNDEELAGLSFWYQNGATPLRILHLESDGNVGIGTVDPVAALHINRDSECLRLEGSSPYLTLYNQGTYNGYLWSPGFGINLELGTANGTTGDLVFSTELNPHMRLKNNGRLALGTSDADAKMEIRYNSSDLNPHLLLRESGNDWARLNFENTQNPNNRWILAAYNGNSPAASTMSFTNQGNGGSFMVLKGNGHVGIRNSNPAHDLVIGENLLTGWEIPAITVGDLEGGVIQVGTPSYKVSLLSSTINDRAQLISTSPAGVGMGDLEVQTGGMSVGINPGDPGSFMFKVLHGGFGMSLERAGSGNNWEFVTNSGNGGLSLYANGFLAGSFDPITGAYSPVSDKRFKTNIQRIASVLPTLLKLSPVQYELNRNNPTEKQSLGFIAQEVKKLFPELVNVSNDERTNGFHTLDYSGFGVLAVKAIQEQQEIIEYQAKEIEDLKSRLKKIEMMLKE